MNKICRLCKTLKDTSEFYKRKSGKIYSECKSCWNSYMRDRNSKNPNEQRKCVYRSIQKRKMRNLLYYKLQCLLSGAKQAERRGIPFHITFDDLLQIYTKQNGKCFYTNLEMKLDSDTPRDPLLLSIDRHEGIKGYIPENVVFCCWGINRLKEKMSEASLITNVKLFYDGMKSLGKIK